MAKEYGNRRSSRSRGTGPHQFLVITLTFLLGYLTASFFDIETVSQWVNSQVLAHHEIKKEAPKPGAQHGAIPPKPKFEFYTLLTNEKVPNSQANTNSAASVQPAATAPTVATSTAPNAASSAVKTTAVNVSSAVASIKPNVSPAANNPPIAKPATPDKGKYLVQVASFKARRDAEQMKGTLILKGFSVYIIPVSHPTKGNWFRVVVGPYSNRALAQQAQITLAKSERLNGMVTSG
ncbi:SPOR domain-containing protein [Fluoribacter gormanii]|uniref:Cell division protein FtsN n=1 Tax=Fluoribacter gormanii TaxID=464 RepID=A0A377GL59_9GAMM|nr:SPOR domain-containing protein [Fluoribacter gormanii]KTD03592.1 Sporulation domain-containing protein [Fluoribacter gormanii]SIR87618.1 cell division protein FtsN [Fluoribacter gormanii]STO25560.1 cell division protein FtsN [Fluoribacter gormanii]